MGLQTALVVAALGASVLLMQSMRSYIVFAAAGIAALQTAQSMGYTHLSLGGLPLPTLLALGLSVCGVVIYGRVAAKTAVAAATVICIAGISQVLSAFGVL
jgi:hypothetical protein